MKICRDEPRRGRAIINVCGPGEVLGELHALRGTGHTANVITIESCETLWMYNSDFLECLRAMPSLNHNVTQLMAERMAHSTQCEANLATRDVAGRLAWQLLNLAHKFGVTAATGLVLSLNPTQQELAEMIGAERGRVNLALPTATPDSGTCSAQPRIAALSADAGGLSWIAVTGANYQ